MKQAVQSVLSLFQLHRSAGEQRTTAAQQKHIRASGFYWRLENKTLSFACECQTHTHTHSTGAVCGGDVCAGMLISCFPCKIGCWAAASWCQGLFLKRTPAPLTHFLITIFPTHCKRRHLTWIWNFSHLHTSATCSPPPHTHSLTDHSDAKKPITQSAF